MLYKTISKHKRTPSDATVDIKDRVLRRAIRYARKQFPAGSTVRLKGTQTTGVVAEIITAVERIAFVGGRPHVVLVDTTDNKRVSCDISQVKRIANVQALCSAKDAGSPGSSCGSLSDQQ